VQEDLHLGLLFLDVDAVRLDTFGHRVGDEVLRMVAQSLANGLNRGDVPARWGGEELVALLPGADRQIVERTAERVRMLVENSWIQKGDDQVRVTVTADSAEDSSTALTG
jgi:diguanylate cyclase (GGDEF)-like protein